MNPLYPTGDMVGRKVRWTGHTEVRDIGTVGVVARIDQRDDECPFTVQWPDVSSPRWTYVGDIEWADVHDNVNSPAHYRLPGGGEVLDITKHMNFPLGNVVKYVLRADLKNGGENAVEDLEKAARYLQVEIERRKAQG